MKASRITYAATHSRRMTRWRRAGATFASADTTIGTLPNGSMTSSNRTAAEKTSAVGIVIASKLRRASDLGARRRRIVIADLRAILQRRSARHVRAMRTAKVTAADFHPVADDAAAAVIAGGCHGEDRTLERVERMRDTADRYREAFVVVVAAAFASRHEKLRFGEKISRRREPRADTAAPSYPCASQRKKAAGGRCFFHKHRRRERHRPFPSSLVYFVGAGVPPLTGAPLAGAGVVAGGAGAGVAAGAGVDAAGVGVAAGAADAAGAGATAAGALVDERIGASGFAASVP